MTDGIWTNDDRADSVREFVMQYRRDNYFHKMPGETEPSEPLSTVIGDIFGNLMHLFDRLDDDDDKDESERSYDGADWAARSAELYYYPERQEEEDGCNTCGGSKRHLSTTEEAPTTLVDLGPCPDC